MMMSLDEVIATINTLRERMHTLEAERAQLTQQITDLEMSVDCLKVHISDLELKLKTAMEAITAFLEKWALVDEAMKPVYTMAWVHGCEYRGPTLETELAHLREVTRNDPH